MTSNQPTNRTFLSDGLKLHYLEWGSAESTPMVLIHHMNSHAHTWDRFAASMSSSYRVLALDMRGHGDSQWASPESYKTGDFASDVAALVDHLGLERAIILVAPWEAGSHWSMQGNTRRKRQRSSWRM